MDIKYYQSNIKLILSKNSNQAIKSIQITPIRIHTSTKSIEIKKKNKNQLQKQKKL